MPKKPPLYPHVPKSQMKTEKEPAETESQVTFSAYEKIEIQHMLNYLDTATQRLETVDGMISKIITPKDSRAEDIKWLFPEVYHRIEHIKEDIEDISQGKPFRHG